MIHRSVALVVGAVLLLAVAACTPSSPSGPPSTTPSPTLAGSVTVGGRVHAGPTCPVAQPNDPACADRPVAGAVLVVTTVAGAEVARVVSAADGSFSVVLAPGDYVVVPQPVTGVLGTAQSQPFHVQAGGAAPARLDIVYDTGIR